MDKSKKNIKSKYGIIFKENFEDKTFNFCIKASYGFYFWDLLSGISNNFIFIDIGANQGLYTICAAKNKFCSEVYSFEPVNDPYLLLIEVCDVHKEYVLDQQNFQVIYIS